MKLKTRLLPYWQSIPKLLCFQLVAVVLLQLWTWGLSELSNLLIGSVGKACVSNGDFSFIFTHWQGYACIALMLLIVLLYVAVDINALLLFCAQLTEGNNPSVWKCIVQGVAALKRYCNLRGFIVILFVTLISPVLGLSVSISLTTGFYIPNFIHSFIWSKPLLAAAEVLLALFLVAVSIFYSFILHGALLDGKSMKAAGIASRRLLRQHWRRFFPEWLRFFLFVAAALAIVLTVFFLLPQLIISMAPLSEPVSLFLGTLFSILSAAITAVALSFAGLFLVIKSILLYRSFTSDGSWHYQPRPKQHHPFVIGGAVVSLAAVVAGAWVLTHYADTLFPSTVTTGIVAHRAGGHQAPENTVRGIAAAHQLGAVGAEIDIQRTADGFYVVNHDDTFARVAGVDKKPSQMTLQEVKQLRVENEPVPTLEDMLNASRDKVTLFVELKGETADRRMADDAVKLIKQMGMEQQTVLISLKYDVLAYIESTYPEMETGYLAFFSFGKIENMPFDYLALEEEIATDAALAALHEQGKKSMVWTVNEEENIHRFLLSEADAIITDEVAAAADEKKALESRTPADRIDDATEDIFD